MDKTEIIALGIVAVVAVLFIRRIFGKKKDGKSCCQNQDCTKKIRHPQAAANIIDLSADLVVKRL